MNTDIRYIFLDLGGTFRVIDEDPAYLSAARAKIAELCGVDSRVNRPLSRRYFLPPASFRYSLIFGFSDDVIFRIMTSAKFTNFAVFRQSADGLFRVFSCLLFSCLYSFATKKRAKNQSKIFVYDFCADFLHTFLGAN